MQLYHQRRIKEISFCVCMCILDAMPCKERKKGGKVLGKKKKEKEKSGGY